ncbi:MAG: molybdate ABC transporter permease subunit [Phycisphaeraceae bacterium]|nr:molybdate ABC transporter permease subunit [Phycisphaeraceae bacterium]
MTRRARRGEGAAGWLLPIIAIAGLSLFLLPLVGLALRTPWGAAWSLLSAAGTLTALRLSAVVSVSAVALSLVYGFPMAWLLARTRCPGRRVIRALALAPMVLPPLVGGIALLSAFGRGGLLGDALGAVGIHLPYTTLGAVIAATFVSAPFMVATLEAGLRDLDGRLESAAATLGATRWVIIRRVVAPQLTPALLAGVALTFARALGEFGATIAFAGNMPGRTQTMPLAIYSALQSDLDGALLLSAVLLVIALVVLLALRWRLFPGGRDA